MKGMKVEAWDRKTPSLVCVATISKDKLTVESLLNVHRYRLLNSNAILKLLPTVWLKGVFFHILDDVDEATGHLLIHFDGWTNTYDYTCETTSIDIHPVGWFDHYINSMAVQENKKNSDGTGARYTMELQKPHGNIQFNIIELFLHS